MKESHHIMLVDDEILVIEPLHRLLKKLNYQVDVFTNPKKALVHARKQRYDLVISDFMMPGIDGIALVKAVRKIFPGTLSIILSGYSQLPSVLSALKNSEISHYVTKPWNDRELVKKISQILNKGKKITSFDSITGKLKDKVLQLEGGGALEKLEIKYPGITQGVWEDHHYFVSK